MLVERKGLGESEQKVNRAALTRALLGGIGVAAAAIAVTGCGGGGGAATAGVSGSGGSGAGTLTMASPNVPASLDPATGDNENDDYHDLAYAPLIYQAPNGQFKPGLATSWKYGPRNKSFSMTLRKGARFSDGSPVNAAAVKTWIQHAMKLPGGRAPTYLASLKSIDVAGPQKLTLRFGSPTPLLELTFSQRLEMGEIGSPKAVAAKDLSTTTDGAGPYMLDKSQTVIGDHYTYVPNPHYYDKAAVHYKKVVIEKMSSPTSTLQALETGQIQLAKDQPVTSIKAAQAAGLKMVAPPDLIMGLTLLDRNGKISKPLRDLRVRQAINYAINRKAVAAVIGAGHGQPDEQIAVPGDDSYEASLNNRYPYDPAKAKQLLAEAGYPHGFTLPVLSATVVGQNTLGEAIAGQLAKVGIKVKLNVADTTADYIKQLSNATSPAATLGFGRLPATILYQLLWGPSAGTFNPFKTASPELTKLNAQLSAAPTSKAPAIARRMQAYTVDQAWFAPVVATPLVQIYRSNIAGVSANPSRPVLYAPEIHPAG